MLAKGSTNVRPSGVSEVLDGRWDCGDRSAKHKTVALQALQGLAEDLVRNAFDLATEFAEAVRAFAQPANNQGGPLVSDSVQCLSRWALLSVNVVFAAAHADMTVAAGKPFQGTPNLATQTWLPAGNRLAASSPLACFSKPLGKR